MINSINAQDAHEYSFNFFYTTYKNELKKINQQIQNKQTN